MNPSGEDLLVRVFSEVLEDFAFLYGDRVPAEKLPAFEGAGYLAMLPFRGVASGGVTVGMPGSLAREIAASSLGLDGADPAAERLAGDAVREVASVLGGHLASSLAGPGSAVSFSPPRLSVLGGEEWDRLLRDPGTLGFCVNVQPVLFRLDLEPKGGTT